jgi:hypothetical protein
MEIGSGFRTCLPDLSSVNHCVRCFGRPETDRRRRSPAELPLFWLRRFLMSPIQHFSREQRLRCANVEQSNHRYGKGDH